MWNLIVSVPGHCLFIYFARLETIYKAGYLPGICCIYASLEIIGIPRFSQIMMTNILHRVWGSGHGLQYGSTFES